MAWESGEPLQRTTHSWHNFDFIFQYKFSSYDIHERVSLYSKQNTVATCWKFPVSVNHPSQCTSLGTIPHLFTQTSHTWGNTYELREADVNTLASNWGACTLNTNYTLLSVQQWVAL